jgi:ubiquitin-activating enzyme E1
MANMANNGENNLTENKRFMDQYSRQIGAYGLETMGRLITLDVLIVGMRGVGIECAKNLCLAGPRSVTVCDPNKVFMRDLGSNFFLTPEHIGRPRGECVTAKLNELNGMVTVKSIPSLTEDAVKKSSVLIYTDGSRDELLKWNAFCRANKVAFMAGDVLGCFGYMFTDFNEHLVRDSNGENPNVRVITNISNDEQGVVTVLTPPEPGARRYGIEENDHDGFIELDDVDGMVDSDGKSINDYGPFKIKSMYNTYKKKDGKEGKRFNAYQFEIGDTSKFSKYEGGGVMTQKKIPFKREFKDLKESLRNPIGKGEYGLLFTDGSKFGRGEQLHFALQGVWEFQSKNNRLPVPRYEDDAKECIRYAKEYNEACQKDESAMAVEEVDEKIVKLVAMFADTEFQPHACFFGGCLAQEAVKLAGKYNPLNQWCHVDCFEVLPEEEVTDGKPSGTRYDDHTILFGSKLQEKIMNQKTFMVGCGALGCELLKNFALGGIGCGPNGLITITDNDRVEVSNLSRQFLFREHNVGLPKSVGAFKAVQLMNDQIKVKALELLVAPNTEKVFNDEFWKGQDFVTNALDNVKARVYVDSKCVYFSKPLLESGTLGTKCNSQVIVPHITKSYADTKDAEEEDHIPMCTLRNFPSLIDHCIEWARAQFTDLFVKPVSDGLKFTEDQGGYLQGLRDKCLDEKHSRANRANAIATELPVLEALKLLISKSRNANFDTCVDMAVETFNSLFRDRIMDLTDRYPADAKTKEGEAFWSGAKRFPAAAKIDINDKLHMDFIISCANIYAANVGLVNSPSKMEYMIPEGHEWRNAGKVGSIVTSMGEKPRKKRSVVIDEAKDDDVSKAEAKTDQSGDGNSLNDDMNDQLNEFQTILNELNETKPLDRPFQPADFEKDQDLNFHIDFITAAANLRARNYRIKEAPKHKCKLIAGKIIPAIATTTAAVTGLVMTEMYKVIQGKGMEAYRDSSNNLGINAYFFSEPAPADQAKDEYDPIMMEEVKCLPAGFTKWDKTEVAIDQGTTLKQFLEIFKKQTGLTCSLLLHSCAETAEEGSKIRGRMLYDSNAWQQKTKELFASKMETPLIDWIKERYAEAELFANPNLRLLPLIPVCADDSGQSFKIPQLVVKWR